MTQEDYRRALEAASREYEALGARRREIDQRLAELAQSIATLSKLLGLTPTVPLGLTDAVRLVVRGAGVPMTPVDVRDRLHAIGFDVSKYTNDLAAVHTILKRLNESGEIRFVARAPGKHQYIWNRGSVPVVLTKDIIQHMHDNLHEREAAGATDVDAPPSSAKASGGKRVSRRRRAR
jgi:hypothetical protein